MKPFSRRLSVVERPRAVELKLPEYMVVITQKEDLRTAYALFETSDKTWISLAQAKSILWNFGYWKLTEKQFESVMHENQVNLEKGRISWEEILAVVTKRYHSGGRNNKIREIFEVFDGKGRGVVTLREIQRVLHENLEFGVGDREIEEIVEGVGVGENGEIGFEQFVEM